MHIIITLRITDPETVEVYHNVHPEIIYSDMVAGTLSDKCEMVGMEVVDAEDNG